MLTSIFGIVNIVFEIISFWRLSANLLLFQEQTKAKLKKKHPFPDPSGAA